MPELHGVKELKEALVGLNELSIFVGGRIKDGIGVDDAVAIFEALTQDGEFKDLILKAVEGVSEVPAEIGDISLNEGIELASTQISYIPRLVEAFTKEPEIVPVVGG